MTLSRQNAGSAPNFLLIVTDQQRWDHVGAYGNREVRTPHLDALAARGWVADRCYVASPACMPNRASLMTGRPPSLVAFRSTVSNSCLPVSGAPEVLKRPKTRS